jgi:outer membrane protein assembly factor BamE
MRSGVSAQPLESFIISRSDIPDVAAHTMRQLIRQLPRPSLPRASAGSVVAALALGVLAGCSSLESNRWTNVFLPYRIEVVQGNVVTSEQIARVAPGMTRVQVRDVLGSPLVTDIFHGDRWDYVFMLDRPGTPLQKRAVVVIFDGDKLARVDAPALPSDSEFINSIDPFRVRREVPTLALSEEQIRALPVPQRPAPAASASEGPVRDYPPLEPRG